jgi:hypothetical protein
MRGGFGYGGGLGGLVGGLDARFLGCVELGEAEDIVGGYVLVGRVACFNERHRVHRLSEARVVQYSKLTASA